MIMTGRKNDPIWNDYDKVFLPNRKGCKARCKSCFKEMEGQVSRMKVHSSKCNQAKGKVDTIQMLSP